MEAGGAGAQATARSERIRPCVVANRFQAISQASMTSARLEVPSWRANGCAERANPLDRVQLSAAGGSSDKVMLPGTTSPGCGASRHDEDHHGIDISGDLVWSR